MTYTQTRWKLEALVPSKESAEIDGAISALEKKMKKLEGWRKKLKASIPAKAFQTLLTDYEAMQWQAQRLYAYSELWFSEDTQNQNALALLTKIQQLVAELQTVSYTHLTLPTIYSV